MYRKLDLDTIFYLNSLAGIIVNQNILEFITAHQISD